MNINHGEEKIKNLKTLIKVSSLISSTFDLPTLTRLIMEIAKKVIKAEAATLMLLDEKTGYLSWDIALGKKGKEIKKVRKLKLGEGIAGWVAKNGKPLIIQDCQHDPRWLKDIDKTTGFMTRSILCVPLKSKDKTIGILEAVNKIGAPTFGQEDLELFMAYAGQAAVAVDNARLHQELLEQEKVKQELLFARRIQQSFLPSSYPRIPGFELSAYNLPARHVGGDFYDFISLPKKLAFFIGDVSGKGVPAALYMARTMHDFRSLSLRYEEPAKVLSELNKSLLERPGSGLFITSLYALLDIPRRKIFFANAGHLPPLRYREGKGEAISKASSPPLGVTKKIKFHTHKISLQKKDLFILYTDGLIESLNPEGQQFGVEGFLGLIPRYAHLAPLKFITEIIKELNAFTASAPSRDDLTLLALKVL